MCMLCVCRRRLVILVQQNSHEGAGDEAESNTNGENLSNDDDNDPNNDAKGETSKAVVAQRIPGWGKVAALAKALINLDRLSVSNEEARNIQVLYGALKEFEKNLLIFILCPLPLKWRQRRLHDNGANEEVQYKTPDTSGSHACLAKGTVVTHYKQETTRYSIVF